MKRLPHSSRFSTGGPYKPSVGLCGAVRLLDGVPPAARSRFLAVHSYTSQSPKDGLATLLVNNLRTTTGDPEYWIAKLPAGEMGWAGNDGKFHPEQFQHLFTLIDDSPNEPSTSVRFIAVEWDGPKGVELVLYRPAGGELKPVIVNHEPVSAQVVAENE